MLLVMRLSAPIAGKIPARTPGDLVGRPVLPQPLADIAAQFRPLEIGRPRTLAAADIGLLLRRHCPVAVATAVAMQL
jgi:hypothetical protein